MSVIDGCLRSSRFRVGSETCDPTSLTGTSTVDHRTHGASGAESAVGQDGEQLLALLRADARRSKASLACELHLSRTAVEERVGRLERDGWIEGYTVISGHPADVGHHALLFLSIVVRPCAPVLRAVRALRPVERVCSLTGPTDAVAEVRVADARELSELIDQIAAIQGIGSVQSETVLRQL